MSREEAGRIVGRVVEYGKRRWVELVEIEMREKEVEAAQIVVRQEVLAYKPVVYPNLVEFNQEIEVEEGQEYKEVSENSYYTESLLSEII